MTNVLKNDYVKSAIIICYGLAMILLSQFIVSLKVEEVTITIDVFYGLLCLLVISLIGIFLSRNIKVNFPVLAWVSVSSLIICLGFWPWSEFVVKSIQSINFLSLTTPVLTFAGIGVANQLSMLGKMSGKIFLVGIFVFIGTFLGSAIIAQILLSFTS
ncbi:MAG: hypothetical protein ACRCUP_04960 [Mycoplasmatales bacterium]